MPVFDQFGQWESIGVIEPTREWQIFPLFCNSPNSTFRIFYHCNRPQYLPLLRPLHLRAAYFAGYYFFDEKWKKLFPKDSPETLQYPYPPDMLTTPLPPRQFQIKHATVRNRLIPDTDVVLTVEIFEKISSNVPYPVGEPSEEEEDPIIIP